MEGTRQRGKELVTVREMSELVKSPLVNIQSLACRILGYVATRKDRDVITILREKTASHACAASVRTSAAEALKSIDGSQIEEDDFGYSEESED
jgi:hypothetical protein